MTRMAGKVLLVGSIPGNDAAEAMSLCGEGLGNFVDCLPDGETGTRRIWINFLAATVYDGNPNLTTLNRPLAVDNQHPEEWRAPHEGWAPRGYEDHWQFALTDPEANLEFPSLGYAAAAIKSYKTFYDLRSIGKIPKHVKFMVAIPLVESGVRIFFTNPGDYPTVRDAYQRALVGEMEKILTNIPADDLVVQWDICMEILAIELNDQAPGLFPWKAPGDPFERFMSSLTHASELVPEQAAMGCHLCYGDLGHKHVIEPESLATVVKLANAAQSRLPRPIDYFHMPVPKTRGDDAYLSPLKHLNIGTAKLYLGLVHHTGGFANTKQRIECASKYADDFGIATECGFGRRPAAQIPELLAIHRRASELL